MPRAAPRKRRKPSPARGGKPGPPKRTQLTPKQLLFVDRYLLTFNATQAYLDVSPGVSLLTANKQGSVLTRDSRIAPIIKARVRAIAAQYKTDGARALHELASIAYVNPRDMYGPDGKLLPLRDMPARVSAAVKRFRSREIEAEDGEGNVKVIGHVHDVELHDKVAALRLIGQHDGLFADRVELTVGREFGDALREARARVIAAAREAIAAPATGATIEGEAHELRDVDGRGEDKMSSIRPGGDQPGGRAP